MPESLFDKVAAAGLQPAPLLKRELGDSCFPVNFATRLGIYFYIRLLHAKSKQRIHKHKYKQKQIINIDSPLASRRVLLEIFRL